MKGSNLVVRFPDGVPDGFDNALMDSLGNALRFVELVATDSPCDDISANLVQGDPVTAQSLQDLLTDDRFRGRLIRLVDIDECSWPSWQDFLGRYAHAIRGEQLLGRTLFCVPLDGSSPSDSPRPDMALTHREWDGTIDEVDLLLLASERLRSRMFSPLARQLLATLVSRVVRWDFDTAVYLLDEGERAILSPLQSLQHIAHDKGWTAETPLDWRRGTMSKSGVAHPARAAVDEPPREIEQRIWSAQLAVLMPRIEELRYNMVQDNRHDIKYLMRLPDPTNLNFEILSQYTALSAADGIPMIGP